MRWALVATVVALTVSGCGSGEARSGSSHATVRLVAVGTPWRDGYPVYGLHVATLSSKGRLSGWDAGREHVNWESTALSPDGSRVATIERGVVQIYSTQTGSLRTLRRLDQLTNDPEWLPDGRRLSFVQRPGQKLPGRVLLILDARSGTIERRLPLPDWTDWVAFSADSRRLAATGIRITGAKPGSTITVVDIDSGHATLVDSLPHDLVDGLAWSPDGAHLAYASWGRGVHVMDSSGGEDRPLWRPPYGLIAISPGSFSPDGGTLAVSWQADFNGADAAAANRGYLIDVARDHGTRFAAAASAPLKSACHDTANVPPSGENEPGEIAISP